MCKKLINIMGVGKMVENNNKFFDAEVVSVLDANKGLVKLKIGNEDKVLVTKPGLEAQIKTVKKGDKLRVGIEDGLIFWIGEIHTTPKKKTSASNKKTTALKLAIEFYGKLSLTHADTDAGIKNVLRIAEEFEKFLEGQPTTKPKKNDVEVVEVVKEI